MQGSPTIANYKQLVGMVGAPSHPKGHLAVPKKINSRPRGTRLTPIFKKNIFFLLPKLILTTGHMDES
jgi:hypothetical protein